MWYMNVARVCMILCCLTSLKQYYDGERLLFVYFPRIFQPYVNFVRNRKLCHGIFTVESHFNNRLESDDIISYVILKRIFDCSDYTHSLMSEITRYKHFLYLL